MTVYSVKCGLSVTFSVSLVKSVVSEDERVGAEEDIWTQKEVTVERTA
jgi:hypothetical protein